MKKLTPTQTTILILLSLVTLCLCATFAALIPSVSPTAPSHPGAPVSSPSPVPTAAPAVPTPLQHQGVRAIFQCRQFIRDRLVSPSSAEFSYEEAYRVNDEPMNYHAVTGIVESKNRMGVLLQSQYRCDAHYLIGSPGEWVLDYLDIDD